MFFTIALGILLLIAGAISLYSSTGTVLFNIILCIAGGMILAHGLIASNKQNGSSSKKSSGFGDLWKPANNFLTWVGGLVFLITSFFIGNALMQWYKTGSISFGASTPETHKVYTPTVPAGVKHNIDLVLGENIISPKGSRYLRDKTWDIFFELKPKNTSAILTFVNEQDPSINWKVRIKNIEGITSFDLLSESIPGNTGVYTVSADRSIACNVYWQ